MVLFKHTNKYETSNQTNIVLVNTRGTIKQSCYFINTRSVISALDNYSIFNFLLSLYATQTNSKRNAPVITGC